MLKGMMTLVLIAVGALVLWLVFGNGDKPTALSADVWAADPETCARNLKLKIEAWKTGTLYVNPERAAEEKAWRVAGYAHSSHTADGSVGGAPSPRKLVRCCPMHKPQWE